MPATPMPPPVTPTTRITARASSAQVMDRPVAKASTGEKDETWFSTQ